MIRTSPHRSFAPAALTVLASLGVLVVMLAFPAPADAQRRPATRTRTVAPTALETATSARRSGESADRAAATLARTHRMDAPRVAEMLLRAGYPSKEVGTALSRELNASPASALRDLGRAGVDETTAFTLMITATSMGEALRALRSSSGSRRSLAVIQRTEAMEEVTAEEQAEAMEEAGYSVEEIVAALMDDPWALGADDLLRIFLLLNITDPQNAPETLTILRERGLEANGALVALVEAGWDAATAVDVMAQAGYAWDEIADGLAWSGRTTRAAARLIRNAGATISETVAWAAAKGGDFAENIMDALVDAGDDPVDVGRALLAEQVPRSEVAELMRAAGASIHAVAEVLHEHGASQDEIADFLRAMGVGLTTFIDVMVSVVGLSAQAAASLFGG